MRVLNITDTIPYPVISGAPLRSYSLLKRVAIEHELWLAAFIETPEHAKGVIHMLDFCKSVETAQAQGGRALTRPFALFRYILEGKPPDLRFMHSAELASKIRRLVSKVDFDIVQIEHGNMAMYLETLPSALHDRTVWMLHDVDFSKYDRISRIERKLARKLRLRLHSYMMQRWKPCYAERFGRCITVSESDKKLLITNNPSLQVGVVPNGVDTSAYQPLPEENTPPALIFIGNMGYRPNVDAVLYFFQDVLPEVRRVIPEVEMWIVGINSGPEIRRLSGDNVIVTGKVDDVRPYYSRSKVCVVPLRAGGGTRLKILEAMALGRPVVSTAIGCEGLDVIDGEHLFIADNHEQFVKKTVLLLTDEALRQRITSNARRLVETDYDWDVIANKLVQIYSEIVV
jgi:sugar transferase (PEP-CTERM/EpsH1 system associated)